jgi:hypothetical protein
MQRVEEAVRALASAATLPEVCPANPRLPSVAVASA